mgnify:CR=1 FL=1
MTCVNLTLYMLVTIKFNHTKNILRKESRTIWFYYFDIFMIIIFSFLIFGILISFIIDTGCRNDYTIFSIYELNGINIEIFEFQTFENLNEKEKMN